MKTYNFIFAVLFLFLISCDSRQPVSKKTEVAVTMHDYHWMVGSWLAHGMEYIEEWSILDDSTMTARVYREEGTDTIISEQIVFSERKGNFVYTPTVKSQNSGQPIIFEATVTTPNEVQFENMAHDFPNRIVYFHTSDQQMDVRIEAVANGQVMKSYDILMSRLK